MDPPELRQRLHHAGSGRRHENGWALRMQPTGLKAAGLFRSAVFGSGRVLVKRLVTWSQIAIAMAVGP